MELKETILNNIEQFKILVSEIDSHFDDSKYLYTLSTKAKWIAHDIDRMHSGYYVAFIERGPDDDSIRIYYPLGFMTAAKAYETLNEELIGDENNLEPWNDSGIIEVTKEKHAKYYELMHLQKLYDNLNHPQYDLRDILPSNFIDNLKIKVDTLRNELGLTRRWMRVCSRY